MTKRKQEILNSTYQAACMAYVVAFCKKQGLEFDYWIGEQSCDIAVMSDYYFNLSAIIYDIQTNQPKGLIMEWQNKEIEYSMAGGEKHISYQSYSMGLRYEDIT